MDKVHKHNSFNTNTPSSESYRNYAYCSFELLWNARVTFIDLKHHANLAEVSLPLSETSQT